MTDNQPQPCAGFPDDCPNPVDVPGCPPHHGGGIRCGCATAYSLPISAITAATMPPQPVFQITGSNGQPLVSIHPDGRTEYGDNYQPDEAAQAFWEAVQRLAGNSMPRTFGAPLEARINAELAAGERAQKQVERLDQMAASWLERLPDTIRTATAVQAIHQVTRGNV
jgi:hypothetical protein